ncbi:hypothetical protein SRHO_G00096540 [Serrasalmus rhombeus]
MESVCCFAVGYSPSAVVLFKRMCVLEKVRSEVFSSRETTASPGRSEASLGRRGSSVVRYSHRVGYRASYLPNPQRGSQEPGAGLGTERFACPAADGASEPWRHPRARNDGVVHSSTAPTFRRQRAVGMLRGTTQRSGAPSWLDSTGHGATTKFGTGRRGALSSSRCTGI